MFDIIMGIMVVPLLEKYLEDMAVRYCYGKYGHTATIKLARGLTCTTDEGSHSKNYG